MSALVTSRSGRTSSHRGGGRPRRGFRFSGLIWLVWRQNRTAFWLGLAVATAVAAWAVLQHQHIVAAVAREHLDACHGPAVTSPRCSGEFVDFEIAYLYPMRHPMQVMMVVPLLFGVFLGGPQLAQELESGTYRTVCSQSVTRARWVAAKLGVPVAMTVVISGILAAAMTWWWRPVAAVVGSEFPWYGSYPYNSIGPVVVGQSVLSLLIGVMLSLMLRRTVAAMAAALAVGAAASFLLDRIRGYLLPSVTASAPHSTDMPGPYDAWVTAEGALSASGRHIPDATSCVGATDYEKCLSAHGITGYWAEFHPASHLWPLQWAETGLCLSLAGALAAWCVWQVRHRLA